jgi:hypothetical protein
MSLAGAARDFYALTKSSWGFIVGLAESYAGSSSFCKENTIYIKLLSI